MAEIHKKIQFNGRTIHFRIEGREHTKTIVLLHGFLQSLTVWSSLTLRLMHNYRVVSIDLPGHGYTSTFNSDCHSVEFIAQCVNEVLISQGISDCVIVGHSWGGYVALAYAKNYEHNLRGIGLINSVITADSDDKRQRRQQCIEEVKSHKPNYILQFIPSLFTNTSQVTLSSTISEMKLNALPITVESIIAAQNGMMRRPSSVEFISQTRLPVMYIFGHQDTRIPLELASAMTTVPAYCEALFLADVGHMAHIENPKATTRWITNFIETAYSN